MSAPQKCAAVVVGAGPAGLAVIGNLLERLPGSKIAWIDPYFQAGRVNRRYREVPSNTKVSLFQAYASAVQPFRTVINTTPTPNAFSTMTKLEQDKGCHLHYAADMCRALTEGILKSDEVYRCCGIVTHADLKENLSQWTVRIKSYESLEEVQVVAPRLILCTGSSPTLLRIPVPALSIQRLDLDVVLKPSELVRAIHTGSPQTVAVVGASHSAILALLNLVDLARSSHPQLRIKWFTRNALRYAEYMDGWILRDNTGLKGVAADFAREQLEDDRLPKSEAGRFIEKIDCSDGKETAAYEAHLPSCSHIVQAVGFTRDPLPELARDGMPLKAEFDHESGGFSDQDGRVIKGLYGAGIAFPERVVDPYNNVEYAVGFFKFMKFIKRVCPRWLAA
uniref:Monooxygenase AgnR1 n=1 Tax=Paecilomyces divaricatus TaxID=644132 RepID=AGNR1_PAEDI|nr:RecName: Full=Monooxygenase AgnR1; AltName: Full=Agnestins biosynthesis cluster protein R1; Flags: Precursor [Paecilomyces divaricatus]QBG38889.1 oxidoreductase [Paecilomyces divaricatus]